jgi:IS30 family transposase
VVSYGHSGFFHHKKCEILLIARQLGVQREDLDREMKESGQKKVKYE